MTEYRIEKFHNSHLDLIVPRDQEKELLRTIPNFKTMAAQLHHHPGATAFANDLALVSAGIVIPWAGLGEAWMYCSPEIMNHKIWFVRAVRAGFQTMIEKFRLRRVQALIDATFPMNTRWATFLGFEYEGSLPYYGPEGETFYRYVLLTGLRGATCQTNKS